MKFNGQFEQDKIVYELFFKNKKNGTFLEIGASGASNCRFFEEEMDWDGIAIDGYEDLYKDIKNTRKCTVLHKILSDVEGDDEFIEIKGYGIGLSGLMSKMSEEQKLRIKKVLTKETLHPSKENKGAKIKKVKTETLCNLLEEYKVYHIDFLSIDTEGSELDILSTVDFNKINIDVITIEDNYNDPVYSKFFIDRGYKLAKQTGVDKIFSKIPTLELKYINNN